MRLSTARLKRRTSCATSRASSIGSVSNASSIVIGRVGWGGGNVSFFLKGAAGGYSRRNHRTNLARRGAFPRAGARASSQSLEPATAVYEVGLKGIRYRKNRTSCRHEQSGKDDRDSVPVKFACEGYPRREAGVVALARKVGRTRGTLARLRCTRDRCRLGERGLPARLFLSRKRGPLDQ